MLALLALTTPVDIYCERTSPAFWAEPWNAATNLSFILAGVWGWREARARGEGNPLVWLLVALAFGIGIGSFLFHTYAQVWAGLADTIPIWTFVALYCFVAASRLGGIRPGRVLAAALVLAAVAALFIANAGGEAPDTPRGPPPLNGSLQYAPAVVAFAIFTAIAYMRGHPLRHWVASAGGMFLLSLTARTFDHAVCGAFPLGLHWIWHLLNGVVIALVLQILIRARDPSPEGSPAARG